MTKQKGFSFFLLIFKIYIFLQKYLIYISIQTFCYETRNWAQVHPVSIDYPWDVSTTWLESTFWKFNWLDMIWKSTHQSKNQAVRSKELSVELRERILSRHRSGEGYWSGDQHWWSPKNTVASIIQWPPIRGEGPWSGRWPRTRWSLWQSSRVPLWKWENLPEGHPYLQHSAIRPQ